MGQGTIKSPKFIVFGQVRFREDEIEEVSKTLRSGWIGTGPKSKEFEAEFAKYQGASGGIAVSSCTAALTLSLKAFGIGPGDEVITTAMTFAATVNAIIESGAKPVLVDVDPVSNNMNLDLVERAITPQTRAIIPVHFAGYPVNIDGLADIRSRFKVKIIQDCAHAIETEWNGKRLGSLLDAACFSFYTTKNITAIEGGMVCSNDPKFLEKVRLLSYQGMSKDAWKRFSSSGYSHYDIVSPGFKLNFTDVQATVGLCQLKDIDSKQKRRREIWNQYQAAFKGLAIGRPNEVPSPHRHALHLYLLRVDSKLCGKMRDDVLVELQNNGIGCGVHYRSIPSMTHFRNTYGWQPEHYPVAKKIGDETLSIPLTPYLTEEEVQRVIQAVHDILGHTMPIRKAA